MGNHRASQEEDVRKDSFRLELWLGDFEEGTKKRRYSLDWVLLESGDNFINKSYL